MNLFDVHSLAYVMHSLHQSETQFSYMKIIGRGADKPEGDGLVRGVAALEFANNFFRLYQLGKCSAHTELAKHQWDRPLLDVSAATEIFHRLQIDIISELENKQFLRVEDDRCEFVDKDRLFGDRVYESFSSANTDIKEAGNCLAAECNTAAVFHLMRASEVSLRALARDRKVSFKDKPLEQKEWGHILSKIDSVVKELRESDAKKWLNPAFKDAQVHFYSELVPELRSFNEAWRRHVSHADTEAFYDRNQALSIMNHVKKFMQKLSTRISEYKSTTEYWESI